MCTIEQIRARRVQRKNKSKVLTLTTGKPELWMAQAMSSTRFNVAKVFTK